MTSNRKSSLDIVDSGALDSKKQQLAASAFWKEYVNYKIEGISRCIQYWQKGVDNFKEKIKDFSSDEDLHWVRSLKRELERDEAFIRLHEAHNQTYSKFAKDLRNLDQSTRIIEEDFNRNLKEFKKMEKEFQTVRKELLSGSEKVGHRLEKMENLLLIENDKKVEKLSLTVEKLEKECSGYDAMILTEERKRKEVLMKSEMLEIQYTEKETTKVEVLLKSWKDCLQSLEDDVTKYANGLFQIKASKNASRVDVHKIVEKFMSTSKKTLAFSEMEASKTLISRNLECQTYLTKLKEQDTEDKGKNTVARRDEKKDVKPETSSRKTSDMEIPNEVDVDVSETRAKRRKHRRSRKVPDVVEQTQTGNVMAHRACTHVVEQDTSDEVVPFSVEDLEEIADDNTVKYRPLPSRPLPSIPKGKIVQRLSNNWMDPSNEPASSDSEEETEVPSSKTTVTPDNRPFQPKKASVKTSYKKQRSAEISVKKGEKVTILDKEDVNGFVLISKKSALKIQTKKGLVPMTLLVIATK